MNEPKITENTECLGGSGSVGEAGDVFKVFPFTGEFEDVVTGRVGVPYLRALRDVLEPAVDVFDETMRGVFGLRREVLQVALFAVAALARTKVALAYEAELSDLPHYDPKVLLAALQEEWAAMVQRDGVLVVAYLPGVRVYLGEMVADLWHRMSLSAFMTVAQLVHQFQPLAGAMRFTRVGHAVVVSDRGAVWSDLSDRDARLPVVSKDHFRSMLTVLRGGKASDERGVLDPCLLPAASKEMADRLGMPCEDLAGWVWLVAFGADRPPDYCYQDLFSPSRRLRACQVLGPLPEVRELLWYIGTGVPSWAGEPAEIVVGESLHVVVPGDLDVEWLRQFPCKRIGVGTPTTPHTDYFARALFDEFVSKHRGPVPVDQAVVQPVDAVFGRLSLDTGQVGQRGFVDVASQHYSGIGAVLSPRAGKRELSHVGGGGGSVSDIDPVDGERAGQLCARLSNGPAISEEYFYRCSRRMRRFRRRPPLPGMAGNSYHVFAGFPAEDGVGMGPWEEDLAWDVPGWTSYVASFEARTEQTVGFVVPGGSADVRIDCTGTGALEFGQCLVGCTSTVLWFSDSVRFKVKTGDSHVTLRVSVPFSLASAAMPVGFRRYLHVPGYTVVVNSFEVVTGRASVGLSLTPSAERPCAGSRVYVGRQHVDRGRHRFKLLQLHSRAPVKLILATEPVTALDYLGVSGLRLKPQVHDYVSVLYDPGNAETWVALNMDAVVRVSVLQVVDEREFDLTVAAVRAAGE